MDDSQAKISETVWEIKNMLKDLMIDFNLSVIIQMSLSQKEDLYSKLKSALENRNKIQFIENSAAAP